MAKVTLPNIGSAYGSVGQLNANYDAIEAGFENTLSRDGTGPNQMEAHLDMNSNDILNTGTVYTGELVLNGVPVSTVPSVAALPATVELFSYTATSGQTVFSVSPLTLTNVNQIIVESNGDVIRPALISVAGSNVTIPAQTLNTPVVIRVFTGDVGAISNSIPSPVGQTGKILGSNGTTFVYVDDQVGASALGEGVNVLDFIDEAEHAAIKNGSSTFDCRPGIQDAIDSLGLKGGRLFIPRGTYELSKNPLEQACLRITCPIIMEGEGYFSVLKPKSDVGTLTNTVTYTPSPLVDCSQSAIRNIFFGDPNTGTRAGNYAIFLDTQATDAYLPELTIEDCFVGESGKAAIAHLHDPNRLPAGNGVNGGVYGLTIEGCQLRGGIRLENSGDSIRILGNIMSGFEMGVYISTIAGASQVHIIGNNITSTRGAIRIDHGRRVHIIGNNIEQTVAGNDNLGSMVNLAGTNGTVIQPFVIGNNMGAFSGTGLVRAIRCGSVEGGLIQDNSMLPSTSTQYGITVTPTTAHMRIGWNQYGTDSAFRVDDNGVGTMGTMRSFQGLLGNSWVAHLANFADCFYTKDHLGFVEIHGSIKNGTLGTLAAPIALFTLPDDYRPAKSEHFKCYSQDSTPAIQDAAVFIVASTGVVNIIQGANGIFTFNVRFYAGKPALTDVRHGSGSTNYGHGPGHTSNN